MQFSHTRTKFIYQVKFLTSFYGDHPLIQLRTPSPQTTQNPNLWAPRDQSLRGMCTARAPFITHFHSRGTYFLPNRLIFFKTSAPLVLGSTAFVEVAVSSRERFNHNKISNSTESRLPRSLPASRVDDRGAVVGRRRSILRPLLERVCVG